MSDGTFFFSRKLKNALVREVRQQGKKYVKAFCELGDGTIHEYTEMRSDFSETPIADYDDNIFLGRGKAHHVE